VWTFGTSSSFAQQLAAMMLGLFKIVLKRGSRVPVLTGYGNGVTIERLRFENDRESLTVDYAVIPEDDDFGAYLVEGAEGVDELHAIREHRRLTRAVEIAMPSLEGWDIQLSTKASSDAVAQLPWTARVFRNLSGLSTSTGPMGDRDGVLLRVHHAALIDDHSILKVRAVIERSGPSSGLRLNGLPQEVEVIEERNPTSFFMSQEMLQDATSTAEFSFQTASSTATAGSTASVSSDSKSPAFPQLVRTMTERSAGAQKSILSRVRRNYIYFSSLLQEPEAKWKKSECGRKM